MKTLSLFTQFWDALLNTLRYGTLPARLQGGIVSFSFDDSPQSAWTAGGTILMEYGLRGTYFVTTGLIGKYSNVFREYLISWPEILKAYGQGFEIAAHSETHHPLDEKTSLEQLRFELSAPLVKLNEAGVILKQTCGFAYPGGMFSRKSLNEVKKTYAYARATGKHINRWPYNRYQICAGPIYQRMKDQYNFESLLNDTSANNAWAVFYTHDISPSPSRCGCTESYFNEVVRLVCKKGLRVMTIGEVIREMDHRVRF